MVFFRAEKKKERDFYIVHEKSPDGQRRAMKNALLLDCSLKINDNNNNINLLLQRVNVLLHFSLHSRALSVSFSLARAARSLFLSLLKVTESCFFVVTFSPFARTWSRQTCQFSTVCP